MRLPRSPLAIVGVALFGAALVSFAFLLLVELARGDAGPYVGLFHYIILPMLGTVGLLLVFVSGWLARRVEQADEPAPWMQRLVALRAQQTALMVFGGVGAAVVFLMSLGGVRAIEYSESASFCGDVCHAVMSPEFTAWQASPHARVDCVECHVGEGAGSYVRAKVRGLAQVIATVSGSYPRPIPTPIHLPGTEVSCEGCHWPARDSGDKPLRREYHLTEGVDDPWLLDMLVKVGGGDRERGFSEGAHWHMNLQNRVEYAAADRQRQIIAWVRFTRPGGEVTEYRNVDIDEEDPGDGDVDMEVRQVDCITCHNRPAHRFETPVVATNHALQRGVLGGDVPGIRWLALELLAADYDTTDEALRAIDADLRAGVEDEDPDWAAANSARIDATVEALQRIFRRNRNPEMGVAWTAYPDNLGHVSDVGCFRCHAGNLVADDGRAISSDCQTCHLITGQGRPGSGWQQDPAGLAFVHPGDGEVMDAPILCVDCHDGSLGY